MSSGFHASLLSHQDSNSCVKSAVQYVTGYVTYRLPANLQAWGACCGYPIEGYEHEGAWSSTNSNSQGRQVLGFQSSNLHVICDTHCCVVLQSARIGTSDAASLHLSVTSAFSVVTWLKLSQRCCDQGCAALLIRYCDDFIGFPQMESHATSVTRIHFSETPLCSLTPMQGAQYRLQAGGSTYVMSLDGA